MDRSGRLWVERYRPPWALEGLSGSWDLFAADGRRLGSMELPFMGTAVKNGTVPPAVRGNRIAGVFRDELGVEYVAVLEIVEG